MYKLRRHDANILTGQDVLLRLGEVGPESPACSSYQYCDSLKLIEAMWSTVRYVYD